MRLCPWALGLALSTPDDVQVASCGPVSGFTPPGDLGHWCLLWGETEEENLHCVHTARLLASHTRQSERRGWWVASLLEMGPGGCVRWGEAVRGAVPSHPCSGRRCLPVPMPWGPRGEGDGLGAPTSLVPTSVHRHGFAPPHPPPRQVPLRRQLCRPGQVTRAPHPLSRACRTHLRIWHQKACGRGDSEIRSDSQAQATPAQDLTWSRSAWGSAGRGDVATWGQLRLRLCHEGPGPRRRLLEGALRSRCASEEHAGEDRCLLSSP